MSHARTDEQPAEARARLARDDAAADRATATAATDRSRDAAGGGDGGRAAAAAADGATATAATDGSHDAAGGADGGSAAAAAASHVRGDGIATALPRRLPVLLLVAGIAAWAASAGIAWLAGLPLGHDEAQYVLTARDMIAGQEPRWFYVSPGTSLLAVPGVLAGGGEVALRLPVFLLGIGFVLAAAAIAWRCAGAATAAWLVAFLAGARSFTALGAELLSDLPAAALLLAGTAVIVGEALREDGPRWRAVLAAPLLAAALYVRYGSCVPIAILGAATLAFGLRTIARRPAPILATAALFLALLVPHALTALRLTGSPLGILLDSKDVPYRTWLAEGLVDYVTVNPFTAYGLLAPPVLLAGLAAVARGRDRRIALLWTVAVLDIIVIGLVSHAQIRYIAYGTALLSILGVDALRRWIAARPPRARAALAAAAALAIATSWALVARAQLRLPARRLATTGPILEAAAAIRADAAGAPCLVASSAYAQLEWYSGCLAAFWPWDRLGKELIYVVLAPRDPPGETHGTPRVLLERPGATVTRYDP